MDGARLATPVDDPYLLAIGYAVICFARCEWAAVWLAERLDPSFPGRTEVRNSRTGELNGPPSKVIANNLVALVGAMSDDPRRGEWESMALEFQRLAQDRNDLLHAKPGTSADGAQRFFRGGVEWTLADVERFADSAADCGRRLIIARGSD